MQKENLYATDTAKSNSRFVDDLKLAAVKRGFTLHNEEKMAMARTFGDHGVAVAEDFDLHMIQICKPEKAAMSLGANPERAVLMPKFIMTFTKDGRTQIRFLRFSQENIMNIVDDDKFPVSLAQTYEAIVDMIEEAKGE